jgi:hypothetical protein
VAKLEKPHCNLVGDYSNERPKLRFADGGRLLKLSFARSPAAQWNDELFGARGGIRGKCKGFSFGSRRRMLDRLNSVSVAAKLPYFATMTLPDDVFDDNCASFAKSAKCWLDTFSKRLLRVCPEACGFWRIEWQTRKSGIYEGKLVPHFHLLVWGLPERSLGFRELIQDGQKGGEVEVLEAFVDCMDHQRSFEMVGLLTSRPIEDGWERKVATEFRGKRVEFAGTHKYVNRVERLLRDAWMGEYCERTGDKVKNDFARFMSFADWAALSWYHVVASQNLDHLTAGVRVERVKSWGGVMSYCAKYMAKSDCGFLYDVSFGRSWGVFNRKAIPWANMIEIDLDGEAGVTLRRIARRYMERRFERRVKAPYGLTLYCDVKNFRRIWERPPPDPF